MMNAENWTVFGLIIAIKCIVIVIQKKHEGINNGK